MGKYSITIHLISAHACKLGIDELATRKKIVANEERVNDVYVGQIGLEVTPPATSMNHSEVDFSLAPSGPLLYLDAVL